MRTEEGGKKKQREDVEEKKKKKGGRKSNKDRLKQWLSLQGEKDRTVEAGMHLRGKKHLAPQSHTLEN